MNRDRKLAILSACNIDGSFIPQEPIPRKGDFSNAPDIEEEHQVGDDFYNKARTKVKGKDVSILDKGHLTKYEDVMWGDGLTEEELVTLARTTNFYPNAVPQHRRLNRGKWSRLELYILDTETEENQLKICMFTGPVLDKMDPVYVYPINDEQVQVPILFWKIIIYQKKGKLYALGFLMSHKTLLTSTKLVREKTVRRKVAEDEVYFMDFKHSAPYQVKVEQIEELAVIKLRACKPIIKPYKDDRPLKTITREIDVRSLNNAKPGKRFLTTTRFINLITTEE